MKGQYIRLLFSVIVIALLIVSFITYRSLNNYIREVALIRHSNRLIRTTQLVLSTVKDAETGHRGFQLTRDTVYLEPYNSAIKLLPAQLKALDSLVSGNKIQMVNADSLRVLTQNQFKIISSILSSTGQSKIIMGELENSLLAYSKINMDDIRAVSKNIVEEEQKVIQNEMDNESEYKTAVPVALLFTTLIALLSVTFLFIRNSQALKRREKTEGLVSANFKQLQHQASLKEERKILLDEAESLAQMGSWKWTENNDELLWSEGLYNILDKKTGEAISWNSFLDNIFQEDQNMVRDCLHDVKTNRNGSSIDYRLIKNGKIHYLSLKVKPHTIQNMDILGTVVDISELKKNEKQLIEYNLNQVRVIKELDEKEKKYRTLFERSIDPIFLATDELVLLDANDSFLKLLNYDTVEEISIRSLIANGEDFDYFKNTLKEFGQIKDFEVWMLTRTGEKMICLLNCVFIPDQALGFSCYQGIIHDLTLRKQAETDMLIAERFSLTGKIARTVAHEVRNPLTNLNLALDQLREEMPADNESAKFYTDIIERNSKRIELLVDEMLNSSKPKQLHLQLTTVDEILNDTISLAIDRINLNQMELLTSYQDNLPRILVDKAKIQVALLNIIINAVEAMIPGKGVLKVNTSMNDKVLTISISDNGKGIPSSDLGKLFDPFFTGKQTGMGLGLTSTKNILNSHNAQVEVKSDLGKGTTFYINFKLAE